MNFTDNFDIIQYQSINLYYKKGKQVGTTYFWEQNEMFWIAS